MGCGRSGSARSRSSPTRLDLVRTAARRLPPVTLTSSLVGAGVAAFAVSLAVLTPAVALGATPALSVTSSDPKVLVVAVPDLRWSDLAVMPRLRSFAESAAVGDLSVKTAEARADCNDGMLSFNAGNRVGSSVAGCGMSLGEFETARRDAADSSFDAQVGAFGHALRSAGLLTEALNVDAVPLLADAAGQVLERPDRTGSVGRGPRVEAVVDDALYVANPDQRTVSAGLLDQKIHEQLSELPDQTTVVIAGISDAPTGGAHLHVLLVRHPGWRHVELARPATPPPYVQLIDLAPTVLSLLGTPVPDSMAGRELHPTSTPARGWAAYADDDRHAQAARSASKPLRYALGIATLAVVLLLVLAGRGIRRRVTPSAATWLARLIVAVPVTAYLIQLSSWWRWSGPAVAAAVAAGAAIGAALVAVAARRGVVAALLVVPAITAAVLLVDQLAGAPLQLSAPLGDNPLIAGRFHGMGNIDFAVFATAVLLCAGVTAGALIARGRRAVAIVVTAAVAGLALVVDGAPPLGDDAGGAVTLLTAVVVLLAVLLGVRVTWRRALAVVAVAVVVVIAAGALDHARGSGAETHLGRFVGQLLGGGGDSDVRRRLTAVGTSLGNVPFTLLVVAAVAVIIAARDPLRRRLAAVDGLPAAAAAVATVAVLGTLLNDSGVVVAAFVLILAVGAIGGAGVLSCTLTDAPDPARGGDAG